VVCTRCGKQQAFSFKRPVLLFQDQTADRFGTGASARFPGFDNVYSSRPKFSPESMELG
jgi:hypothetical protein